MHGDVVTYCSGGSRLGFFDSSCEGEVPGTVENPRLHAASKSKKVELGAPVLYSNTSLSASMPTGAQTVPIMEVHVSRELANSLLQAAVRCYRRTRAGLHYLKPTRPTPTPPSLAHARSSSRCEAGASDNATTTGKLYALDVFTSDSSLNADCRSTPARSWRDNLHCSAEAPEPV